jgi:glycosyltransferase involved in cell wall biosynthesis
MNISIVIPAYNRPQLLNRAIDSISKQTYENIETIIVDDGSKEDLSTVVNFDEQKNIKFKRHSKNKGANAARNTGINSANGKYTLFLDSDDQLKPKAIENIVKVVGDEKNNCIGVSLSREIRYSDGSSEKENNNGKIYQGDLLHKQNYVSGIGGKCLRTKYLRQNRLDEKVTYYEDFDLLYPLMENKYIIGIEEPQYIYNIHGSQKRDDRTSELKSRIHVFNKYKSSMSQKEKSTQLHLIGCTYMRLDSVRSARRTFLQAIKYHPIDSMYWRALFYSVFGLTGRFK